jgi:uncharacterized membrane protein (DUF106 family)
MSYEQDVENLREARKIAAPYIEAMREAEERGDTAAAQELWQIMMHLTAEYQLDELPFR